MAHAENSVATMADVTGRTLPSGVRRKITMVVSHLTPAFGLERVALTTTKLLGQSYEVEIICVGGTEADQRLHPAVQVLGAPLRGWRRIGSIRRLWRLATKLETDTVILAGVWVALPWLLVVSPRKFKTIVWEHSLLSRRTSTSTQMRILATGARILYPRSESIVAVSGPLQRDVSALTAKDVVVIPNPVETPPDDELIRADTLDEQGPIRLITVGSLTAIKSQEIVIRALSLLDERYCLTIVGAGPLGEALRDLVELLGLSERVTFAGFLEKGRLRSELRKADLMVHCAQVETFGLVYVEAANEGLPVLSTSSDVALEMIPSYVPGWVCSADPASVAAEVSERSRERLHTDVVLKAAARRRAKFASESVLKQWQHSIENL